jgi:hypothetical protein
MKEFSRALRSEYALDFARFAVETIDFTPGPFVVDIEPSPKGGVIVLVSDQKTDKRCDMAGHIALGAVDPIDKTFGIMIEAIGVCCDAIITHELRLQTDELYAARDAAGLRAAEAAQAALLHETAGGAA